MKLTTIWTIPAMSFIERLRRTRDWAALAVAGLLPLRIRYWTTVREISKASIKDPEAVIPELTIMDVMENLERPARVS